MYSNNKEYRAYLRDFFQMKSNLPDKDGNNNNDIDEETLDEMNYDETSVSDHLNDIYYKTKNITAFCELYRIAAGHMFSVDLETGLTVLLSYDYLFYFKIVYEKFKYILQLCNSGPLDIYKNNKNSENNSSNLINYTMISKQLENTDEYKQLLKLIKPNR